MKQYLIGFYALLMVLTSGLMVWGQFSLQERIWALGFETVGFFYAILAMKMAKISGGNR